MSIGYNVRENALTSPPSYKCQAVAAATLDWDDVATQINIHNPGITAATAKTVLEAFRAEVKTQILAGNWVNLTNFISLVATLPQRLVNPTDPASAANVNVSGKVSTTFKDEVRNEATLNRLGYPVKAPLIIAGWDANTDISNMIRVGEPFAIQGENFGVSRDDAETGIFTRYHNGTEVKQTSLATLNPSSAVIVPAITMPSAAYPEISIVVKGRYTPEGQIREGVFANRVRAIVPDTELVLFNVFGRLSPIYYTAQSGGVAGLYKFICQIKQDGTVTIAGGPLAGPLGPEVTLTANGNYTMSGVGAVPFDFEVTAFDDLVQNVTAYQRYMQEIVDLQVTA